MLWKEESKKKQTCFFCFQTWRACVRGWRVCVRCVCFLWALTLHWRQVATPTWTINTHIWSPQATQPQVGHTPGLCVFWDIRRLNLKTQPFFYLLKLSFLVAFPDVVFGSECWFLKSQIGVKIKNNWSVVVLSPNPALISFILLKTWNIVFTLTLDFVNSVCVSVLAC